MSGIDEQNRIGIKCKWCDAQGSFVHTDFNKLLDVHLHGERIYISTREDSHPDCRMFEVSVGETPYRNIPNISWTSIISTGRDIHNYWTCKSCGSRIDSKSMPSTWDDITHYIGGYYFYDMIYIGKKETMDRLCGYESELNVRD